MKSSHRFSHSHAATLQYSPRTNLRAGWKLGGLFGILHYLHVRSLVLDDARRNRLLRRKIVIQAIVAVSRPKVPLILQKVSAVLRRATRARSKGGRRLIAASERETAFLPSQPRTSRSAGDARFVALFTSRQLLPTYYPLQKAYQTLSCTCC